MPSTHSDRLERWLGAEQVAGVSKSMRGWYGPPIALGGVPGGVWATADGDFVGRCEAGQHTSALDRADAMVMRMRRAEQRRVAAHCGRKQRGMAGFASVADLVAEARAGKLATHTFRKTTNGIAGNCFSHWLYGPTPAVGARGAAAPGGTANSLTTTGAMALPNASVAGDTQHFVSSRTTCEVSTNTLLLYDRLFSVVKTMNSITTEAVTGVPTRYQSSVATAQDYAAGNFMFPEVVTVLAATAHNWTVCTYTDQDGNAGAALPSLTGIASGPINTIDIAFGGAPHWFMPLAAGDTGVKALTQMQCSAAVATGAIDFVIGHPIAWMPCGVANMVCTGSSLRTALNLTRIFDNACLSLIETQRLLFNSPTYYGQFVTVSG